MSKKIRPVNKSQDKTHDKSPTVFQRDVLKAEIAIRELNWTDKQRQFINEVGDKRNQVIFVNGPAGSSKTAISMFCLLQALNTKKISDLVFVRSIVESSDNKLGFLPGEISAKICPYLVPFFDKLSMFISQTDIASLQKDERISAIPISFLRGLDWNRRGIVLDECFPDTTMISTELGIKSIKTLKILQDAGLELPRSKSYNETTKSFELDHIDSIVSKGIRETVIVKAGNRKIRCTPEHKFLTEVGWVEAENLKSGDRLIANEVESLQSLAVLNSDQYQIFLGSYLGDGSIHRVGSNRVRCRVIHGMKQAGYCRWKADQFNAETTQILKNGYSQKPAVKFTTKCFALPHDFVSGQKTECPDWVLQDLDARGLAIWFMDDGWSNQKKNSSAIYTCSFNTETQHKFVKYFKDRFNIDVTIGIDAGEGYSYSNLRFNKENLLKLHKVIAPYIHTDIAYKIEESILNVSTPYVWDKKFNNYRHVVVDKVQNDRKQIEVFDLSIRKNHNFIVCSKTVSKSLKNNGSGVVVHNCQNLSVKELLTFMTRIGKYNKVFILGDPDQSDIRNSGFAQVFDLFDNQESRDKGIACFKFGPEDVMRSDLCKFIAQKFGEMKRVHKEYNASQKKSQLESLKPGEEWRPSVK